MTISESLISWLKGFNTDKRRIKKINTGIQPAAVEDFAVVKEPTVNVKKDVFGDEEVTAHYTIMARLPSNTNPDRIDNEAFGEAMETWILDKNRLKEYPDIQGYRVTNVAVTTPFYAGKTETNNSVYQMTVALKYER